MGEERDEAVAAGGPGRRPPSRRVVTVVVAFLITITIAGTLGNIFLAPLRKEHPLIVLLLDARNRQLILVSNAMDAVSFVVVGSLRRMMSDPLYYLLGYWYGERAVRWIEEKLGTGGSVVRTAERAFAKAAPVMVFLFPGPLVCVLAGASGMSPLMFAAFNLAGTLTVVLGLRLFSNVLEDPIRNLTTFVDNNAKWLAVLAVLSTLYLFWQQRRTGRGELQALTDLANDVTDDTGDARDSETSRDQPSVQDDG